MAFGIHSISVSLKISSTSNIFSFFLRFYLFIHEGERETERERCRDTGRGRSRLPAGSLMQAGPGLRTPGSQPELKADAQPLSHPGTPALIFIFNLKTFCSRNKSNLCSLITILLVLIRVEVFVFCRQLHIFIWF